MKQKILIVAILFSTLIISLGIISSGNIFAQNPFEEKIQYPVEELGNCKNREACKKYCDNPQNFDACIDFAEKNNMMPREEIEMAKKFMAGGGKGPGGCRGKEECEAYCDNIDNINECVDFAEQNDILPPKELEEAKKVREAIKKGIKPPACGSKKKCDVYCGQPEHMEECISFAEAAGFIPPEELDDVKKVLEAIKKGVKPPACRGKEECDIYCSDESHFEECISFAEAAGFIPPEEIEIIRKTGGKGPGGCRGKDKCETFCQNEENMETCANFALEHGLMNPEEFEMMKKTGGKGPGGCRGKEECEVFCNNPENQEICFNFAKENNLISPEEIGKMKEGMREMKKNLQMAPPEISECLKSTVGEDVLNKIQDGTFAPPRELGEQMRKCFEGFMKNPSKDMKSLRNMRPFKDKRFSEDEMENKDEIENEIEDEIKDETENEMENKMKDMMENEIRDEMFREGKQMFPEGEIYQKQYQERMRKMPPKDYYPEGVMPPEGYSKSPEEFIPKSDEIHQYEQEYQRQYQQQYEQIAPPPSEILPQTETPPPSSLINPNFLLGLIFGFIGR